jgi:hypothetical protein
VHPKGNFVTARTVQNLIGSAEETTSERPAGRVYVQREE